MESIIDPNANSDASTLVAVGITLTVTSMLTLAFRVYACRPDSKPLEPGRKPLACEISTSRLLIWHRWLDAGRDLGMRYHFAIRLRASTD